jgi:hypothetical protein
MSWDDIRLSRFQKSRGTSWWLVALAFALGAGGGYLVGVRQATPPPPPEVPPSTTVVTKAGPRTPRDPLLAALHAASPVQTCFARHGSRKDADKHEVIRFALTIETDGSVEAASVTAPGRSSLQSCLMEALTSTSFPPQRVRRDVGLHTEMGSWFR